MSDVDEKPDKPPLSPEAKKLLAARLAAVEELKAIDNVERSISDHFVTRLASARLYEQSIMQRVVSGEPITSSEFKAASDMVEAARANVPKPVNVSIRYVGEPEHCPKCGFHYDGKGPRPVPVQIEGTVENKERTAGHGKPGAQPSVQATRRLPPPHNPRWSDDVPDRQYAKAVNFTQGVEGFVKKTAWSGSQALFGAHGGPVKGNGRLPGDSDFKPAPVTEK
jgi:hypothetical protein